MVRGKGAAPGTKEFQEQAYQASKSVPLGESEVRELREQKAMLESSLQEANEAIGSSRGIDKDKIKAKISNIDRTIEDRSQVVHRGSSKDRIMAQERELEDKLVRGLPTHWEMDKPSKNPGAVDKNLNWLKKNDPFIRQWVEVQNAKVAMGEERKYIDQLRREK